MGKIYPGNEYSMALFWAALCPLSFSDCFRWSFDLCQESLPVLEAGQSE